MDKFMHSRIFRCLVCLILVCCLLVNISPVRSEATVVGATLVGGTAAAGITAVLFAMAMGVVFVDLTAEMINGLGQSFKDYIYDYYEDDESTTGSIVDPFFNDLQYSFGGSGDGTGNGDGSGSGGSTDPNLVHLPTAILAGLIEWGKTVISDGKVDVEQEVVEESPTFHDAPIEFSVGEYTYIVTSVIPIACFLITGTFGGNTFMCPTVISSEDGSFKVNSSSRYLSQWSDNLYGNYFALWIYSDNTVVSGIPIVHLGEFESQSAFYAAISDYSYLLTSTQTTTVTPSTYVGDIPSQVQNGNFDDDDLKLPYINYGGYLNDPNYVSGLNNLGSNLSSGNITYNEYYNTINNYYTESNPDPEPDPEPDPDPDPSEESPPDEEDPDDPSIYNIDLTDFFPFCIPYDIYEIFQIIVAPPEAPKFHWVLEDLEGNVYEIDVDLSPWDPLAAFFRDLELLMFIFGLMWVTRDLIKW